jgi:hypothetical protein
MNVNSACAASWLCVHVTHRTAPAPSQPLKAEPAGSRHNAAHGELERMGTMAIVDLKRRTEEELEKRSWAKALANLDTVIPAVASVAGCPLPASS